MYEQVKEYWEKNVCNTEVAKAEKLSKKYFDEIEEYKYRVEPEIHAFAQFTRYHGQTVLEVGVGAGTDFIQWVRAGALAYGIDITENAIDHVKSRLKIYGLSAQEVKVASAENLPYTNNYFDLVYSWGVIHHTPDTLKAFQEIIRVIKVGGTGKIMVYNRHSLSSLFKYFYDGLFKGKPFVSVSTILARSQESPGTKAYTRNEIKNMLSKYPVTIKQISSRVTAHDLSAAKNPLLKFIPYMLACIMGFNNAGWFMTIEFEKTGELPG
jgi:ubiquinone/menaquinone biosynthesis C-methylase UbiE